MKRVGQGFIETTVVDDIAFNTQYQNYQRSGYAVDIHSNAILGDREKCAREEREPLKKKRKDSVKADKQVAILNALMEYGSEEEEAAGPWIPVKTDNSTATATATASTKTHTRGLEEDQPLPDNVHILEPEEEEEKWEKVNERKMGFIMPPRPKRGSLIPDATSTFHGDSEKDFQGRSWMSVPQGIHPDEDGSEHDCYLPKKCVHRLAGHSKGVQCIEFYPKTGHLLLSASMDGKCKIWDAQSDFRCLRSYSGHSEGVRSVEMSPDGKTFLSSGFDRIIRHWDIETGQAKSSLTNRKMSYCVRHSPIDPDLFLAAASDNRIYQWDLRNGEMVQEYNYHLQPCNTVTFVDGGRKFVSTSDDKKVLVWDFGIPVPIKYIAEPEMHSVPSVTLHPSGSYLAGQSMDNTIVVYTAGERVKQVKKKTFRGHNNSGYACQIGFSPNGKFLISGDGLGQLYAWDWKTGRVFRKFHAHDNGPCMGAQWHPLHPNRIATCGWDGFVKIWE
eukprot:gene5347-5883_t